MELLLTSLGTLKTAPHFNHSTSLHAACTNRSGEGFALHTDLVTIPHCQSKDPLQCTAAPLTHTRHLVLPYVVHRHIRAADSDAHNTRLPAAIILPCISSGHGPIFAVRWKRTAA